MPIRMRTNKNTDSICKVCGDSQKEVVEMFDISFTPKNQITICDFCMNQLLDKTLHMVCETNHKVKTPKDLKAIRRRHKRGLL